MKKDSLFTGLAFITLSAVFYASYGIWAKLMGDSFGEFSQGWTRGFIILCFLIPIGVYTKAYKKIQKKDWIWFILIGSGGLNQAPYYYAFQHLQVGTATLLFYASLTIAGYIVGKVVFFEKITLVKIFSFFLALVGMLVLFGFSFENNFASALAVVAGIMGGYAVTLTKKVSHKYTTLHVLTMVVAFECALNIPPALYFSDIVPRIAISTPWLAQLGYTASFFFANLFVIKGYSHVEASIGSLAGLSEIIFAVILGMLFFGESITLASTVGGLLILIAGVLPNMKPFNSC